jgi:hypothetical protein
MGIKTISDSARGRIFGLLAIRAQIFGAWKI